MAALSLSVGKRKRIEPSWLELHDDILVEIVKRIYSFRDLVNFSAVCTSWRSVATKEKLNTSPRVPWLIFPKGNGRSLYEFSEGKIVHKNYLPSSLVNCFASQGWLLIKSAEQIYLMHPFSHVKIPLPSMISYIKSRKPVNFLTKMITKAFLSCRPTERSDFSVMIMFKNSCYGLATTKLAFWKAGEQVWTAIDTDSSCVNGTYWKGQFYYIDAKYRILICEVGGPNPTTKARVVLELPGGLLKRVYELDFEKDKCLEVLNLDKKALFLSENSSSSSVEGLSLSQSGCKPNCIYFTETSSNFYNCTEVSQNSTDFCGGMMGTYNKKLILQGQDEASWDILGDTVWWFIRKKRGPHCLPLARIKKIMKKSGDDVKMISREAPIVFSKSCELFIEELTQRSWMVTMQGKRRTLHKEDVASAVIATDIFDFLVNLVANNSCNSMDNPDQEINIRS
ncbi:hypothetical protein GH714_010116 [Hevea brasiliensis]|uniref:F-box domain-containing protein n=1 Tax=Hevea brasiliensis TaxID=3981 RepID=A0A6A6MJX1_HEVBR|nr:hypothetical protein GH714_010116 [Hevea brasiliensis]